MRKYKWFACLVMICLIAMGLPGCNSTPSPSLFTIDPTHSYSFEGWGTSLAWWAEVVGQWSDATKRAALEDALFNPDTGLGLNVIRYNFGASTSNDHCSPNSFRIGGNVPTYQPRLPSSGDNGYDWTQDQAQLTVLKEARDRGANIFEGFANSAPAWMLKNDCPQGNGGSNNLSPTHEEDYAH